MLNWGAERPPYRKLLVEGNPANLVDMEKLIPKDYTNIRNRVLSAQEIQALKIALDANPVKKEIQIVIWLCLSCTCRIGELLMTEWSHIDFEARTWFIPKANSKGRDKTKTDHTVYLSDFALKQFKELHTLTGNSKWAFPATFTDQHVCERSASKVIGDRQLKFMNRSRKLANRTENNSLVIGSEQWTLHDLRTTSATMIQKLVSKDDKGNKGIFIAQLCLHHKVITGAAEHYLFDDYKDILKEAWQTLGHELEKLTA